MNSLQRLLLEKYQPDSPLLLAPVEVKKAAAKKVMTLIMSSDNFSESVIMKAVQDFNSKHCELLSSSYTLPVAMFGIPAGSWVLVTTGGVELE
ncbi:hypothetical protein [Pseudomonas sp. CCC2.2]|uniref:hypothetical protein n=1 Tax=Pseudomonas sp. CCC2.2 TaxID=3048605 RepID=UPI002B23B58E|nr:hypothetical protein [Pseudomonas sp. CCC2.2]MEB0149048.1 hypothetical protein [Pseudomonas sp. CCC2.2]